MASIPMLNWFHSLRTKPIGMPTADMVGLQMPYAIISSPEFNPAGWALLRSIAQAMRTTCKDSSINNIRDDYSSSRIFAQDANVRDFVILKSKSLRPVFLRLRL